MATSEEILARKLRERGGRSSAPAPTPADPPAIPPAPPSPRPAPVPPSEPPTPRPEPVPVPGSVEVIKEDVIGLEHSLQDARARYDAMSDADKDLWKDEYEASVREAEQLLQDMRDSLGKEIAGSMLVQAQLTQEQVVRELDTAFEQKRVDGGGMSREYLETYGTFKGKARRVLGRMIGGALGTTAGVVVAEKAAGGVMGASAKAALIGLPIPLVGAAAGLTAAALVGAVLSWRGMQAVSALRTRESLLQGENLANLEQQLIDIAQHTQEERARLLQTLITNEHEGFVSRSVKRLFVSGASTAVGGGLALAGFAAAQAGPRSLIMPSQFPHFMNNAATGMMTTAHKAAAFIMKIQSMIH